MRPSRPMRVLPFDPMSMGESDWEEEEQTALPSSVASDPIVVLVTEIHGSGKVTAFIHEEGQQ
jgi:hypothetical protein